MTGPWTQVINWGEREGGLGGLLFETLLHEMSNRKVHAQLTQILVLYCIRHSLTVPSRPARKKKSHTRRSNRGNEKV